MLIISRLELLHLRDGLQSVLQEEEDYDVGEIEEGLEIIEAILNGQEVDVCESES